MQLRSSRIYSSTASTPPSASAATKKLKSSSTTMKPELDSTAMKLEPGSPTKAESITPEPSTVTSTPNKPNLGTYLSALKCAKKVSVECKPVSFINTREQSRYVRGQPKSGHPDRQRRITIKVAKRKMKMKKSKNGFFLVVQTRCALESGKAVEYENVSKYKSPNYCWHTTVVVYCNNSAVVYDPAFDPAELGKSKSELWDLDRLGVVKGMLGVKNATKILVGGGDGGKGAVGEESEEYCKNWVKDMIEYVGKGGDLVKWAKTEGYLLAKTK